MNGPHRVLDAIKTSCWLLIQELGWQNNEQQIIDIVFIHIRKKLFSPSLLTYVILILGRLIHLRFILSRIYDVFTIYQTAWNTKAEPVAPVGTGHFAHAKKSPVYHYW